MKLADLQEELAAMAAEAPVSADSAQRLAGVDRKVATHKRARLATASTGLIAAVATAAVLVPHVFDNGTSPSPTEPGPAVSKLPVTTVNGVDFYAHPAGDTLVDADVSDRGDTELATTLSAPASSDVSFATYCSGYSGTFSLTVNGHPISSESCNDPGDPLQPTTVFTGGPEKNAAAWADADVVAGKPVTVTLRLDQQATHETGNAVIGVGLYDLTGPEAITNGVWVAQEVVVGDVEYGIVALNFAPLADGRGKVSVPRTQVDGPLYAEVGVSGVSSGYDVYGLGDMARSQSSRGGASLTGGIIDDALDPIQGSVRTHGDPDGQVYVLVYAPVTD